MTDLVPALLPPANPLYPSPDIILHIGLAAGRKHFSLEQGAHSRGYGKIPDVDGEKTGDTLAEENFPPAEFPDKLTTTFDTSDVLARWKAYLGYSSVDGDAKVEGCPDVRLSPDAGNFMCGFIYYNSLAHYYSVSREERPVVFLHVPDLSSSEEKLHEGWEVAVALIKALVESLKKFGVKNGSADGTGDAKAKGVEAQTDNNFA